MSLPEERRRHIEEIQESFLSLEAGLFQEKLASLTDKDLHSLSKALSVKKESTLESAAHSPERKSGASREKSFEISLGDKAGFSKEDIDGKRLEAQDQSWMEASPEHDRHQEQLLATLESESEALLKKVEPLGWRAVPLLVRLIRGFLSQVLKIHNDESQVDSPAAIEAKSGSSQHTLRDIFPQPLWDLFVRLWRAEQRRDAMTRGPEPNDDAPGPQMLTAEELGQIPLYPGRGHDSMQWYKRHWALLVKAGRAWQHQVHSHDLRFFETLRKRCQRTGTPIWQLFPAKPGHKSSSRKQ